MAQPLKAPKDDALKRLLINDFAGGLNVNKGALDLNANESPDMLNVIPFNGRLQYRGGWTQYSTIPFPADDAYSFYDSGGALHYAIWANGNLYDVVSGAPILVAAAVYTHVAGNRIGHTQLNGILYWSTQTVPLQFWDPQLGTFGAVAQTGTSMPPSGTYLTVYTGSIVSFAVNFTTSPSTYQPNVFAWSATNQPGNWTAANSQVVGPTNGGHIEFGTQFGISEIGVDPFRTLIVGRADNGIYAYQGALGQLTESVINCPVGCLDEGSVQYLPSAQSFGTLVFLGTDGQVWATNGITAAPVSTPILPILAPAVQSALLNNNAQRFWSNFNQKWQYYYVDIAGIQFVYKWDINAWTKFSGWPSGPAFSVNTGGTVNFGVSNLYVASSIAGNLVVAQVGVYNVGDNGSNPNIYWSSPWLHMGDPMRFKEFNWAAPYWYSTGTNYTLSATSMMRADGTSLTSGLLTFNAPTSAGSGNYFILNVSTLNSSAVLAPSTVFSTGTGVPIQNFGRLYATAKGVGALAGYSGAQQMQGGAIQITVAFSGGAIDYELIGLEVRYAERGYLRDGGMNYNPQGGVVGNDPIIGPNP